MKVSIRYANPRGKGITCKPVLHVTTEDGDVHQFPMEDRMRMRDAQHLCRELVAGAHPIDEQYGSDRWSEHEPMQVETLDG